MTPEPRSSRRLAEEFIDGFTPGKGLSLADYIEEAFQWLQDRTLFSTPEPVEVSEIVTPRMIQAAREVADGVDDSAFERIYLAMRGFDSVGRDK